MEARVAKLESDVAHIRSDIVEIRTDIREVRSEIRDFRREMSASLDAIRESIASAKIGGVLLYVALAGTLLVTMAKGFKWL
jgi:predicted  nucleic acid-binding Zn-ribbon protein